MPILTINLTVEQAQKLSAAVKFMDGLANNATQAEVEAHYKKKMRADVLESERIIHKKSFSPSDFGN
jgi:hypothetical protein